MQNFKTRKALNVLKMISKGNLTWNSSQNRNWSATMKMTYKNPEKISILHGWDMVRTFTRKSDEKVTF